MCVVVALSIVLLVYCTVYIRNVYTRRLRYTVIHYTMYYCTCVYVSLYILTFYTHRLIRLCHYFTTTMYYATCVVCHVNWERLYTEIDTPAPLLHTYNSTCVVFHVYSDILYTKIESPVVTVNLRLFSWIRTYRSTISHLQTSHRII